MSDEITANLNNSNCLVTKVHFGYDNIINICSGKQQIIDWTFGDWARVLALTGVAMLFACFIAAIAYMIFHDPY